MWNLSHNIGAQYNQNFFNLEQMLYLVLVIV